MTSLPWLAAEGSDFPPTSAALAEPNGLLAAGGELTVERLTQAYRRGIFPWYEEGQPLLWWSPDPRSVLLPDSMYISKSLARTLRRGIYSVTADTDFQSVMRACAAPRVDFEGTWITDEMIEAYTDLFQSGLAHSIEAWDDQGDLVGGLYGVAIGRAFFGESMFSLKPDTSKVALATLLRQLQKWEFEIIDCQVENPHLKSLGAELLPREEFERRLITAVDHPTITERWTRAFSALSL